MQGIPFPPIVPPIAPISPGADPSGGSAPASPSIGERLVRWGEQINDTTVANDSKDIKDCKCKNNDHPDLYRSGNAAGPRMDNVRVPKDIVIDGNGMVYPDTGGLSTFDSPGDGKNWWKLPANYPIPSGVCLINDHGNHWLWEPAMPMRYTDFLNILGTTSSAWSPVK